MLLTERLGHDNGRCKTNNIHSTTKHVGQTVTHIHMKILMIYNEKNNFFKNDTLPPWYGQ